MWFQRGLGVRKQISASGRGGEIPGGVPEDTQAGCVKLKFLPVVTVGFQKTLGAAVEWGLDSEGPEGLVGVSWLPGGAGGAGGVGFGAGLGGAKSFSYTRSVVLIINSCWLSSSSECHQQTL